MNLEVSSWMNRVSVRAVQRVVGAAYATLGLVGAVACTTSATSVAEDASAGSCTKLDGTYDVETTLTVSCDPFATVSLDTVTVSTDRGRVTLRLKSGGNATSWDCAMSGCACTLTGSPIATPFTFDATGFTHETTDEKGCTTTARGTRR